MTDIDFVPACQATPTTMIKFFSASGPFCAHCPFHSPLRKRLFLPPDDEIISLLENCSLPQLSFTPGQKKALRIQKAGYYFGVAISAVGFLILGFLFLQLVKFIFPITWEIFGRFIF